jgi:gliding motility-associated-like protein
MRLKNIKPKMKPMNQIKNFSIAAVAMLLGAPVATSQIIGTGGYLIGDYVEIGVNSNGHEGAPDIAGSNARSDMWTSPLIYFGFVSNPAMDGWGNYDGDFFTPGSPENGFGLEIGGVNYSNNATGWPAPQIPGSITGYSVVGDCIMVDWDGSVLGIDMHIRYKLITTELYYTTTVTLTNTNAFDMPNVYYYRNFDPDNNEPIGWSYVTTNKILAQPNPTCEIALVSAEQFNIWNNYVGIGAIGPDFRVTYGGFSNRDASDIWNGVAPFTQAVGSTMVNDIAISLAYKIPNFVAGSTEEFQFTIVMSSADVDAAIGSLYHFDYSGSSGVIDECNPVVDTVKICPGSSATITVDGPGASDYTWEWTPPTDLSTTTGPTTDASPPVTTTYTVTGTPAAACLSTEITKDIVVQMLAPPAGPDVVDDACNSGDVIDLDIYILPIAAGGTWVESTVPPSGSFTPGTGMFDATDLPAGSYTFDYMVTTLPPCPQDTCVITINVAQQVNAGADNSDDICNHPGSILNLNTLLSSDADGGGAWTETVFSTGFDGLNTFDANGLAPGDYTFTYTVPGVAPCPADAATMTVTILTPPTIVANSSVAGPMDAEVCEGQPVILTGSGAGAGGTYMWDSGAVNGAPFVQAPGTITYTVTGTDANGCWSTDDIDVIVHPTPVVDFNADEVLGCTPFSVQFTGESSPAGESCVWYFGDGNSGTGCGSVSNLYETEGIYSVTYEVTSIHGCKNQITKVDYITVEKMPEATFTFAPWRPVVEDTEVDFYNHSEFADSYSWDFGDASPAVTNENPTHTFPEEKGNIDYMVTLTAFNSIGCESTFTQVVHVDDIIVFYIPNIFTPDGDEHNETFKPVFYSGIDPYNFHMTIWNRYGEVVFETFNPGSGWDGTYGDRGLIQDGTYIWSLEFGDNNSDKRHKHHGHVTILK